jgi:DNA-binding response OmpR family regulator
MAKLLIIDDDKHICEYIRKFFEKRKLIVVVAHSGAEGLERFRKEQPDVTLLDIKMPDLGGLEVLKQIKQGDPKSKVIMMTVASNDENKRKATELGADDFIRKPINTEYLEGTVALKVATHTHERKGSR